MSCQVYHPAAHRKQFSDTEPNIRQSFWNSLEDGEEKFKESERPKTSYVNLQSQLTSAYGDIERLNHQQECMHVLALGCLHI